MTCDIDASCDTCRDGSCVLCYFDMVDYSFPALSCPQALPFVVMLLAAGCWLIYPIVSVGCTLVSSRRTTLDVDTFGVNFLSLHMLLLDNMLLRDVLYLQWVDCL